MPLPQTPPGGGGRPARTHWHYVTTKPSQQWGAWIAGPCHWFTCHTNGRSVPCLHEMTGGELTCERCSAGQGTDVIGYQPIYRELDGRPCMVIVHEYSREVIDKLRLHQRVIVGRGPKTSDGVYIAPAMQAQPRYHSTLADRMRAADLTETLLRLWRLPDLEAWYRQTHGAPTSSTSSAPEPGPVPAETTPLRSDGKPFGAMNRAAAARYKGPEVPASEATDAIIKRFGNNVAKLPPSQNGQH